jgi:5-methylcytosine-specific restriction endonuclease McrA
MQEIGPNNELNRQRRQHRTERNKLYIRYLKAVATCKDCGSREDLTFDHLPGHEKKGNITDLVSKGSLGKLRREIAKCEIVCWPCHARRENERGVAVHAVD